MKNKTFFKKIYLLLFILLFNCEKESDVENDTANNGIILSVQSFEEFPKLTELTQQVLKRGKDKINIASAKNTDNLYDFSIDSTSIVQAAFEGSFWYTMKIYRDDYSANFFENLVVVDKKEEAPSAYLYKYFPDKAYLEAVEFDINTPFTGHVKHIPIDYDLLGITSRTYCTTTTVSVCGNNGGASGSGCSTNADGGAHVYSVTTTKCYSFPDYYSSTANTIDEGMSGSGGGSNADGRIDEQPSTNDVLDADVITKPVRSLDTSSYNLLRANLGITDANQLRFLQENPWVADELFDFIKDNSYSSWAKDFVKESIEFLLENRLSQQTNRAQLVEHIAILTNTIEKYGTEPYKELAIYLKSVNSISSDFSDSELYNYYTQVWDYRLAMQWNRVGTVATPFLTDLALPVIEYALFQVGGTLAVKLLGKIPVKWVLRGTTLTPMIQNILKLGVQGKQSHVRIINTSSPLVTSRALFQALTKNAKSIKNLGNETLLADMGNGNTILFRTVSKSDFPATIELNFPLLLDGVRTVIKFPGL
jgi:hypothetical protein